MPCTDIDRRVARERAQINLHNVNYDVLSIASCVLSILLVVLVVAVMKWKKKDEEEMRLKEEEYMSRRVSAANIARTKVRFYRIK